MKKVHKTRKIIIKITVNKTSFNFVSKIIQLQLICIDQQKKNAISLVFIMLIIFGIWEVLIKRILFLIANLRWFYTKLKRYCRRNLKNL